MSEEKKITDEDLARQNIFGGTPKAPETPAEPVEPTEPPAEPTEPVTPVEPAEPVEPTEPVTPTEPTEPTEPPAEPTPVDYSNIPEEKVLELLNKKFNTNFDSMEAATQTVAGQIEYRKQEEIIKKLVDKYKDTNVLSYFGSENSYKVNQLAKEHPGKEGILTKVINSDVSNLSDFEAIELAEKMAKPAGTKVNVLGVKLRTMGITDDIKDFDEWDDMDKQVVIGAAEDAREALSKLQSKIEIPKEGENGEVEAYISELESGFQAAEAKERETIETNTPIVESLVDSLTKIKPVEGSDFEFDIVMDAEAKKDYLEYLVAESVEGNYNINSDNDIKRLQGMLEQEVWASEGPKIMKAYGKHIEDKTWAEANAKFGNNAPLDDPAPPADPTKKEVTDEDRARALLGQ
jgi:hypothetical protein